MSEHRLQRFVDENDRDLGVNRLYVTPGGHLEQLLHNFSLTGHFSTILPLSPQPVEVKRRGTSGAAYSKKSCFIGSYSSFVNLPR
jgi:hypothetical protein